MMITTKLPSVSSPYTCRGVSMRVSGVLAITYIFRQSVYSLVKTDHTVPIGCCMGNALGNEHN